MHLKVLWTALNVFSMHLGRNRHWVPPSFENNNNNNNNNKTDIAHINFTLPAYLQLHSRSQILPFSWAENTRSLSSLDNILWSKT